MPEEVFGERYEFLPRAEILTFEETTRLVSIFTSIGAVKLRLTGGEPLIRANVTRLVGMLASVPGVEDLTLTTNGVLLAKNAAALKKAGLRRITVSLDSLDDDVFKKMNGRGIGTEPVLAGIEAAEETGLSPIKINAVVQKGINDHSVVGLARHFKDTGRIVRFIEFMDVGTLNRWDMSEVVTANQIVDMIDAEMPLEPVEANYVGEVARRYQYRDGSGEIGVIASVTQPFCGACTRARLTTDGKLVTCLFAAGGVDLRDPLRNGASDEELRAIITAVWADRADRYSEDRSAGVIPDTDNPSNLKRIEMYQIGG
jgi:cyclic pyranopterin phosphate synthase